MNRIAIIGSGNVAEAFAYAVSGSKNYRLVQIFARNEARSKVLASQLGCGNSGSNLAEADIYIIAVSDHAIADLSKKFDFGNAIVAHTAGSVPMETLSSTIIHRGVIYPLQTLSAGYKVDFRDVPLFIEGSDCETITALKALAHELTPNVCEASSDQRLHLHLSAVFACNFTNAMYRIAQGLLKENNIDPSLVNNLIKLTADKAISNPDAALIQTGPARRGDTSTMEKHLQMLDNKPELQDIYKIISLNIWETSKKI